MVSLDPRMSRALRAWRHGDPPVVDVLLLDVESVAKSWLDAGARNPMAVVLAGALHGYAGDLDAARRAFHFTQTLPAKQRRRHGMTILSALSEEQRELLIGELPVQDQHDWMDVERRSGTYHFGVKEGREQGREDTLREVLLDLLAERGLKVSAKAKAKIRKCKDLPTLKRWVREAVHATSVAELLAD
ncbi:MAG TPA: hypothetical protein VM869_08245 [Enhygromyxa sp.]|nr:hypothetical protein [Enhygromyxa sp.]